MFWDDFSTSVPHPYQIFGGDEALWHTLGMSVHESIQLNGYAWTLLHPTSITGTYAFGYPLYIGFVFSLLGDSVFWVLFTKQIFYAIGCLCFHGFIHGYLNSRKVAMGGLMFCLLYPPLVIHSISLMREEIIFTLFSAAFYFFQRSENNKNKFTYISCYILSFISLIMLATFRLHAALAAAVLILIMAHNYRRSFPIMSIALTIAILYISGFWQYVYNFAISASGYGLNVYDILYSFLKFFFAPLPWNIPSSNHHSYNAWWYWISLVIALLSPLLFTNINKSIKKAYPIFIFILIYLFVYILAARQMGGYHMTVGPRQFAVVGPFVFICFYSESIRRFRFR